MLSNTCDDIETMFYSKYLTITKYNTYRNSNLS